MVLECWSNLMDGVRCQDLPFARHHLPSAGCLQLHVQPSPIQAPPLMNPCPGSIA